jgi:hypothetical protein
MVDVQHAKETSKKVQEMIEDIIQVMHKRGSKFGDGKKNFRAPFQTHPTGHGPTCLKRERVWKKAAVTYISHYTDVCLERMRKIIKNLNLIRWFPVSCFKKQDMKGDRL